MTNENTMDIRRPEMPEQATGPGSGPAARGETTGRKPIMVSKTYTLPQRLSTRLRVAAALVGRQQSELIAEFIEPGVDKIIEDKRYLIDDTT